jgi:uncharacterized damage-inducible protein DinB
MTSDASVRLDIVPIWRRLNGMLIELVDLVPDDRLDWSPQQELWSFRRLFLHLCEAREQWMVRAINDGVRDIDVYKNVHTKDEIKEAFRRTWERIERVFTDEARLDTVYKDRYWKGAPPYNGHWVAFHLLEHDIHHRAELYLYMGLAGLAVPERTDVMP